MTTIPEIDDHWKQECELWYLMTSDAGHYGREVKPVLEWLLSLILD